MAVRNHGGGHIHLIAQPSSKQINGLLLHYYLGF
ncbi:hypothetical protein NIES4103_21560 [Nostoc sp. NIES-4103]|nr:hypothetical protein NIES4103_21560 [Nostoc sp. NIES-4103]